jgi:hypothetical protein
MGLQVADRFMYKAFEAAGLPSVLWVVQLDPRGASSIAHRCKQASSPTHVMRPVRPSEGLTRRLVVRSLARTGEQASDWQRQSRFEVG